MKPNPRFEHLQLLMLPKFGSKECRGRNKDVYPISSILNQMIKSLINVNTKQENNKSKNLRGIEWKIRNSTRSKRKKEPERLFAHNRHKQNH